MFLLLIATLGGRWSFEGFASDPARPVPSQPGPAVPAPVGPATPDPTVAPPVPTLPAATVEVMARPSAEVESPPARKSSAPRTTAAEAPTRPSPWRLADVSGQVWEHADPRWLRCWVAHRNARLAPSRVVPRRGPLTSSGRPAITPFWLVSRDH